jgi:cation-transporting ATPase E
MDVREPSASFGSELPTGLTQREAEARHRRGEGNVAVTASSRS